MNKPITLLVFCLLFFGMNAHAQDELDTAREQATKKDTRTIGVLSFDGKNKEVKIIPDYVHRVLEISCSNDTLTIDDFWGAPPEIRLLGKHFIELKWPVRGGSNYGLAKLAIICVNRSKLCEAMYVLQRSNWDSGDKTSDYHIKLSLKGHNRGRYRLKVNVHDDVRSKDAAENYRYDSQTILSFDARHYVFYSVKKDVYGTFLAVLGKKKIRRKIDGNFPLIMLGTENYYFIKNKWCQIDDGTKIREFE
jgi:hypothetical protein